MLWMLLAPTQSIAWEIYDRSNLLDSCWKLGTDRLLSLFLCLLTRIHRQSYKTHSPRTRSLPPPLIMAQISVCGCLYGCFNVTWLLLQLSHGKAWLCRLSWNWWGVYCSQCSDGFSRWFVSYSAEGGPLQTHSQVRNCGKFAASKFHHFSASLCSQLRYDGYETAAQSVSHLISSFPPTSPSSRLSHLVQLGLRTEGEGMPL